MEAQHRPSTSGRVPLPRDPGLVRLSAPPSTLSLVSKWNEKYRIFDILKATLVLELMKKHSTSWMLWWQGKAPASPGGLAAPVVRGPISPARPSTEKAPFQPPPTPRGSAQELQPEQATQSPAHKVRLACCRVHSLYYRIRLLGTLQTYLEPHSCRSRKESFSQLNSPAISTKPVCLWRRPGPAALPFRSCHLRTVQPQPE